MSNLKVLKEAGRQRHNITNTRQRLSSFVIMRSDKLENVVTTEKNCETRDRGRQRENNPDSLLLQHSDVSAHE